MNIRVLNVSAMFGILVTQLMSQGTPGVDVKISLADTSVCFHEPLQILLSVSNPGDRNIATNFGRRSEEFIRIASRRPGGQWSEGKQPLRSGFAGLGIVRLSPGEQKSIILIADKWIGSLPEGPYQLKVILHAPATDRSWDPPEGLELARQIDQESVFEFRVNAPCPARLAELANSDVATILGSDSVQNKQRASEHLSYIDDDVAIPYMERAIIPNSIGNRDIVDGLERIGDERAKEALTRLSTNPDPNIAAYARQKAGPRYR